MERLRVNYVGQLGYISGKMGRLIVTPRSSKGSSRRLQHAVVGLISVLIPTVVGVTPVLALSEVFPSSYTVVAGNHVSGNAASLAADDGDYLVVRSTKTGTKTATWYGTFTGVDNGLTSLSATYIGSSALTCTQVISIWRWTDSTWVQLDSRSIGTTEVEIADLTPAGTLADYVSGTSGTGDVRLQVSCTTGVAQFNLSGELQQLLVESEPPSVQLTQPGDGATLFAEETLAATASSGIGIDRVEFVVDNVVVGTATTTPYEIQWDTTTVADGLHAVLARAFDTADGQSDSELSTVEVGNGLSGPERVLVDGEDGTLTLDERALFGVWSLGNQELLPARYQSTETPGVEGTTLLVGFLRDWDQLASGTQQEIDEFFAVSVNGTAEDCSHSVEVLGGRATLTCLRVVDNPDPLGAPLFHILYNPSSDQTHGVTQEYIDTLATELLAAWNTYAGELLYDQPELPVTVNVLRLFGASFVPPRGNDQDIFLHKESDPEYLSRHELFHRFAMEYWGENKLLSHWGPNLWWHELTAEWGAHIAGEGRADANAYDDRLPEFLADTASSLTSGFPITGPTPRVYGAFIFAEYLEERLGGLGSEVVKEVYTAIQGGVDVSAPEAVAMVVDEHESPAAADVDMRRVMQGFAASTYTLGYEDEDAETWRAVLDLPGSPTEGDSLSALARPARDTVLLDDFMSPVTGDASLGSGGFAYIDIGLEDGLSGLLQVEVFSVEGPGGVYSASLMTHSTYPDPCHEPVFRSGVGSQTMLSVSVGEEWGCEFATLALVHNDPLATGEQPELSWRATLLPFLRNNAEGGSDEQEAVADPPVNNTGGASGDAFDFAWGAVFDDDGPVSDGSFSYRVSGDPGLDGGQLTWNYAGMPAESFAAAARVNFSGYPDEQVRSYVPFLQLLANDPATGYISGPEFVDVTDVSIDVRLSADGVLGLGVLRWDDGLDQYDVVESETTELVPLSETVRVELQVFPSRIEIRLYDDDSGVLITSLVQETALLDLAALSIDTASMTYGSTAGEAGTFPTYWLDELEAPDFAP
jgi:hypothetical protein